MQPSREIDEATADRLLARVLAPVDGELQPVVAFLADLRAVALAPPAPVSEPLAAILARGLPHPADATASVPVPVRARRHVPRWRRILVSATAGIALAGGGMTMAAAADLLPDGVRRVVSSIVEALTPFELDKGERPPLPGLDAGDSSSGSSPAAPGGTGGETPAGRGEVPTPPGPTADGRPSSGESAGPGSAGTGGIPVAPPASTGAPGGGPSDPPTTPGVPTVGVPTTSTLPAVTLPPVPTTPPTTVSVPTAPTTLPPLPRR